MPIPTLDNRPVIDETLLWIWTAYCDLNGARLMGSGIQYSEIRAYAELYDFDEEDTMDLIEWVDYLDKEYYKIMKKNKPGKGSSPPINLPTPSPPPKVTIFPKRRN